MISDETIQISVPITNTGKRDGTEVVQVYVRKVNDDDGPIKTLKGFKRIEIANGETEQALIDLPPSSFEFYDWSKLEMAVIPGEYEIFYGNSSDTEDLKKITVNIQ